MQPTPYGATAARQDGKQRHLIQEKHVASVESNLQAEIDHGSLEGLKVSPAVDVDNNAPFQPCFFQKIQDLEVVEGSAARFDIIVKGM